MKNRFLLDLFSKVSDRETFFAIWIAIVIGFIWLMVRHYRKQTRRNFKP